MPFIYGPGKSDLGKNKYRNALKTAISDYLNHPDLYKFINQFVAYKKLPEDDIKARE